MAKLCNDGHKSFSLDDELCNFSLLINIHVNLDKNPRF